MYKIKLNKISNEEALKKTGRIQYLNDEVGKNAPQTKLKEVEIEFFKLGKYVTDDELQKEYESRGLEPSDILTLSTFDVSNSKVMDEMQYVGTHWKNDDGKWCYALFYRWGGERKVHVDRNDGGWDDYWWFAGVRKVSSQDSKIKPSLDTQPLDTLSEINTRLERIEELLNKHFK